MSRQYNYPPPPPPPPPSGGYAQYQQSYPSSQPRGGGSARGRGGGNHGSEGRGDYHASQYETHGPSYPNQPPPAGYGQQGQPPQYIGPQAPPGGYQGAPQWQRDQPPPPQQAGHPPHQAPPAAVPLSASNYHPNYAPQLYTQHQYGPQQPYPPNPPNAYHPQPQPPPQPSHWNGHQHPPAPAPHSPPGRGRGRGGFDAPLMGPPIRMGFNNDRQGNQAPQASNGYPQQYPHPQQGPPYQGYPPHHFGHRPDQNSHQSHFRGRGGFRGRRDFNDRNRQRFHKPHSPDSTFSDLPQKPGAGEDKKSRKKKKRKTNTLGLTPSGEDPDDSEEEEEDVGDEESRIVAVLGDDAPQMPTDLESWIAERKRRYPTRARVEAKVAEQSKRNAELAAEKSAEKAKAVKVGESAATEANKLKESKLEKKQRKAEKLRKQLERAEQELQQAAAKAGMKRKRLSTNDDGEDETDAVDQLIAQATAEKDASDSEASDSSSSSSSSSASEPETQSSKVPQASIQQPPVTASGATVGAGPPKIQRHCKYFSTGGTCGKKGKCRFLHDQATRTAALKEKAMNGGKLTLAQRMIQNDRDKDDLTIFKSVMALKERGLFDAHPASESKNEQA